MILTVFRVLGMLVKFGELIFCSRATAVIIYGGPAGGRPRGSNGLCTVWSMGQSEVSTLA